MLIASFVRRSSARRTPEFDVEKAWNALLSAKSLADILTSPFLLECRARTSEETSRWQGAPPKFSKDGRIAIITIHSAFQVHPLIATRWASTLKASKNLVLVMVSPTLAPTHVLQPANCDPIVLQRFVHAFQNPLFLPSSPL